MGSTIDPAEHGSENNGWRAPPRIPVQAPSCCWRREPIPARRRGARTPSTERSMLPIQDDKGRAHGQHDRNRRGIQQPGEIPGIKELGVEDGDEQTEKHQHGDWCKCPVSPEYRDDPGADCTAIPSRHFSGLPTRSANAAEPRPREHNPQPRLFQCNSLSDTGSGRMPCPRSP